MPYVPVLARHGRHRARRHHARLAGTVTVAAALALAACGTSRITGTLSPVIGRSPSVSASPSQAPSSAPASPTPSATPAATPTTQAPKPPTGDA